MSNFYKPCTYNNETKQQMWLSVVGDFHDSFCQCEFPFCHLLDCIFPEGHKDRDLKVKQIIARDYKECLASGGTAEENLGLAAGFAAASDLKEEEDPGFIRDEDLTGILDAAAFAAASTR